MDPGIGAIGFDKAHPVSKGKDILRLFIRDINLQHVLQLENEVHTVCRAHRFTKRYFGEIVKRPLDKSRR